MSLWRRLNNRIERGLDRASLREPLAQTEKLRGGGVPCLASQALERAVQQAHRLDADARLKRIVASQGAAADGAAGRWLFQFELPVARATLRCDWYLDGDSAAGRFGRECLETRATPFPPPDSDAARRVAAGSLAYAQLAALWREERRRQGDLMLVFDDSDVAIAALQKQGLVLDGTRFTLHAEVLPVVGASWVATTAAQTWRCRFA